MNNCNCENCQLKSLFFENVAEKELGLLCSSRQERQYSKGDLMIEQGTEIRDFTYLKSGLVKLYKDLGNGHHQIIKFARPFDFVNLLSIFSEKTYRYSVAALEDSSVCYVSIDLVKELIHRNGNFAFDLLQKMSRITDDLINTTLEIGRKNLRGRIAYVLLYFANSVYNKPEFDLPVSRKEIAELIEMTTENVIRILSEFRKDGIIKIYGKRIEIENIKMLEQIAQFG